MQVRRPVKNILLVDDYAPGLTTRKAYLERDRFIVTTSTTPLEALFHCCVQKFDAAVVDYSMPNANGRALFHVFRRVWPAMAVILLSGVPELRWQVNETQVFDAYVAKGGLEAGRLVRLGEVIRRTIDDRAWAYQRELRIKARKKGIA